MLVTGASGFIGAEVCAQLLALDATVHGVGDTRPAANCTVAHRAHLPADGRDLVRTVAPSVVVHLACPIDMGQGEPTRARLRPGVRDATVALAEAAAATGARFVFISSCAVYEGGLAPFGENDALRPMSAYGQLKVEAERAVREVANLRWTCVRPFRAYGPGCTTGLIAQVCQAVVRREPVAISDGTQTREWNHVSSLATGIVRAAAGPGRFGRTLNLGGGHRVSVGEIAHRIVHLAGADPGLLEIGAIARRFGEVQRFWGDHRRADLCLGALPLVGLNAGLAQTIEWHRARAIKPQTPLTR